jgi:AbrB family looped-hinge helix DNA binding protein
VWHNGAVKNGERNPVVGVGGRITLPRAVREAANLKEGDALQLRVTPDGVLLCRAEERDPDQWWFWTDEWQKKEREADEELRDPDRVRRVLSAEEFEAELAKWDRQTESTTESEEPIADLRLV